MVHCKMEFLCNSLNVKSTEKILCMQLVRHWMSNTDIQDDLPLSVLKAYKIFPPKRRLAPMC